jgi:hypothetical protein
MRHCSEKNKTGYYWLESRHSNRSRIVSGQASTTGLFKIFPAKNPGMPSANYSPGIFSAQATKRKQELLLAWPIS